jgi:hypothetical protein
MLINATTVDLENIAPDILMVGFADMEADEETFLVLQRPLEFPDSNYYIEVNDQSCASYGGIKKIILTRENVSIILEEDVQERLMAEGLPLENLSESISVNFDIDDEQFEQLQQKLQQIFDGHHCYSENLV